MLTIIKQKERQIHQRVQHVTVSNTLLCQAHSFFLLIDTCSLTFPCQHAAVVYIHTVLGVALNCPLLCRPFSIPKCALLVWTHVNNVRIMQWSAWLRLGVSFGLHKNFFFSQNTPKFIVVKAITLAVSTQSTNLRMYIFTK